MIEKLKVLKRLQSLKNKTNELEASQELRKQDVQEKKVKEEFYIHVKLCLFLKGLITD